MKKIISLVIGISLLMGLLPFALYQGVAMGQTAPTLSAWFNYYPAGVPVGSSFRVEICVKNDGPGDAVNVVADLVIGNASRASSATPPLNIGNLAETEIVCGNFTVQCDGIGGVAYTVDLTGQDSVSGDPINVSLPNIGINQIPRSGCFIATAAYGSYLDPHVQTLRDFRDQYMMINPVGEAFVSLYYDVSPPIARFIDDHPALKPLVRMSLLPAVALGKAVVDTNTAEKAAIGGSMGLVSVAAVVWLRRRSQRAGRLT